MGFFGNQGSTSSSSSSTTTMSGNRDQTQQLQSGNAFNLGSGQVTGRSRVDYHIEGDVGGDSTRVGRGGRLTINNNLNAKLAQDTVRTFADLTSHLLDSASSQNGILADLAKSNQDGVLSAVTGRSIGPDGARVMLPIVLAAAALGALYMLKGR